MIELLAAIALAYFAFKIKIRKIILPVLLGNLVIHPLAYFVPQLFNFKSAFMTAQGMDINGKGQMGESCNFKFYHKPDFIVYWSVHDFLDMTKAIFK